MGGAPLPEGWKSVRLTIRGRVQGVSYRYWTVTEATARGLHGWVRNRRDGSVEAFVSGLARRNRFRAAAHGVTEGVMPGLDRHLVPVGARLPGHARQ
jgi:acylphosphatase